MTATMAATDSLEEIQSMRECLNQLPSIKDNQQLVATTSTIVTKLRSFNDALPQRDVLQRLSLQVQPSLVDVVSISEEIAGGNDENRWKLDEATRRLSANLCDVESVLVEEMRDDRSAEETLTHYRAKLEERRERMGKSVVGEKLESTLESSREELSHGVDHLEKALAHPSPNRDDVTRPAAVVAKAVCSLLDVADTYFQTPLVYRSELYGHTMSVIRIAKNYILDVEEMKTAVSRLTVSVQSIREQCQNQMGRSASLQIEVESLKQVKLGVMLVCDLLSITKEGCLSGAMALHVVPSQFGSARAAPEQHQNYSNALAHTPSTDYYALLCRSICQSKERLTLIVDWPSKSRSGDSGPEMQTGAVIHTLHTLPVTHTYILACMGVSQ